MSRFVQIFWEKVKTQKINMEWFHQKRATEYYSSPPKNDIFFALVLTYRISLGSFFSLYSPFFLVLDQKLILKSFCLKIHNNKAFKGIAYRM